MTENKLTVSRNIIILLFVGIVILGVGYNQANSRIGALQRKLDIWKEIAIESTAHHQIEDMYGFDISEIALQSRTHLKIATFDGEIYEFVLEMNEWTLVNGGVRTQ